MNFKEELKERTLLFENDLADFLPEEKGYQKTVISAMNYSILAGGKRLRPIIMQETYRMFGGQGKEILPLMVALEMIHTYSLVHDDLPAMDDDALRRGRATTHVKFGEDIAILAGDALLNYAMETAIEAESVACLKILMRKAGIYGMIGGQTADVLAEKSTNQEQEENELSKLIGAWGGSKVAVGADKDMEKLLFIHENKTAALIEAAMMIGALFAGASKEEVDAVERIAKNVGLAFQIQDDILDVEGDDAVLGKPCGSDEKNKKLTYVSFAGLEKSKEKVKTLTEEAVSLFDELPGENVFLKELLLNLVTREY